MQFLAVLIMSLISAFSFSAQAEKIVLDPGNEVIVYDVPTTVTCSQNAGFRRYCRCTSENLEGYFGLELVLDRAGRSDELSHYTTQALCEEHLLQHPACLP